MKISEHALQRIKERFSVGKQKHFNEKMKKLMLNIEAAQIALNKAKQDLKNFDKEVDDHYSEIIKTAIVGGRRIEPKRTLDAILKYKDTCDYYQLQNVVVVIEHKTEIVKTVLPYVKSTWKEYKNIFNP